MCLVVVGGALVVGGGRVCGDLGGEGGMVMDVIEVMLTSSLELAPSAKIQSRAAFFSLWLP